MLDLIDNKYYRPSEIAKIYSVHPRTIRRLLSDKKTNGLYYVMVGNQHKILGKDIKEFFKNER